MTAKKLRETLVGKTIDDVEYNEGEKTAYLITKDGFGVEVLVEPTYEEEE